MLKGIELINLLGRNATAKVVELLLSEGKATVGFQGDGAVGVGDTIVLAVERETQTEGGLVDTHVLQRYVEVLARFVEVGFGLFAHLVLRLDLDLDIAEHNVLGGLELGFSLAELGQREVFEILLHVLLTGITFEEGHYLGILIGNLKHRSAVEHQRSLVGVLLRDDVVEFLDGVANTSLGVEIEAELVGTATEGVDLLLGEHTLLFALELDSLVYQGTMVDGVVIGIVIETVFEDRHHEEVFLGLVLQCDLEEAAGHTAVVTAVAGHGVHLMADGYRHTLQSDTFDSTEGVTALAECHLLQKFGIIFVDSPELVVVECQEGYLVVFGQAHEVVIGAQRVGDVLAIGDVEELVTTADIVDLTGRELTGGLGSQCVDGVALVERIVAGVVVLAGNIGEVIVERWTYLHLAVEGVGQLYLEEATGGLHIGVAILGHTVIERSNLDKDIVECHVGVGLERQTVATTDDVGLEVGSLFLVIFDEAVDINNGNAHKIVALKIDQFVEGIQGIGNCTAGIAHTLAATEEAVHLIQVELDGSLGVQGDILLIEVVDSRSVGIFRILEGVADDGEALDGLVGSVDELYIPEVGGFADVGIAIAGHGVEQGKEAYGDVVDVGDGVDAEVAVALADEGGLHRAEVGLLDGLQQFLVVDVDMGIAELIHIDVLVHEVLEVAVQLSCVAGHILAILTGCTGDDTGATEEQLMVGFGELVGLSGLEGDSVLVPIGDAGGVYLVFIGELELQVGGYFVVTITCVGKLHIKEEVTLLEIGAGIAGHLGHFGTDGHIDVAQNNARRGLVLNLLGLYECLLGVLIAFAEELAQSLGIEKRKFCSIGIYRTENVGEILFLDGVAWLQLIGTIFADLVEVSADVVELVSFEGKGLARAYGDGFVEALGIAIAAVDDTIFQLKQ